MRRFLRRKWIIRFAALLLVLLGLGPLLAREFVKWRGSARLARMAAELDETDPGWRLEALAASHNAQLPPADRNSFTLVERAHAALPEEWQIRVPPNVLSGKRPANERMPNLDVAMLAIVIDDAKPALAVAWELADRPDGGREIDFPAVPFGVDQGGAGQCGAVGRLLALDAVAAAHDSRPADAIRSTRACLNAARAIGSEPVLMSQHRRTGVAKLSAEAATIALGLGEPQEGMAELQAEFTREAAFPYHIHGFRGARAADYQMLVLYDQRAISFERLDDLRNVRPPTGWEAAGVWFLSAYVPDNNADLLEMYTAYLSAGSTDPNLADAFQAVPKPDRSDFRRMFARMLRIGPDVFADSCLRTRAKLLSAAAGIACERFRRKSSCWPTDLAEIPASIQPEVPTDPFTARPLSLKRTEDGIVVYSVGFDRQDSGGVLSDDRYNTRGTDIGIRLWDPDKRRQPPPPENEP